MLGIGIRDAYPIVYLVKWPALCQIKHVIWNSETWGGCVSFTAPVVLKILFAFLHFPSFRVFPLSCHNSHTWKVHLDSSEIPCLLCPVPSPCTCPTVQLWKSITQRASIILYVGCSLSGCDNKMQSWLWCLSRRHIQSLAKAVPVFWRLLSAWPKWLAFKI